MRLLLFLMVKYGARGEAFKMTNRVDGVHQVFLKDPDGYWIEVNDAK